MDFNYDDLIKHMKKLIDCGELTILFMKFSDIGGMTTSRNGHTLIVINSARSPEKQLQSFIHEAIHVYLNHDTERKEESENLTDFVTSQIIDELKEVKKYEGICREVSAASGWD